MKKASLAVACVLALIVTVFAQSTGQRRVGWANTVTELLSLTPSREAYVYVTKGNLYSTNLDGKILAYDPSSTATVNNTNVWAPDSGIGRWLLISTLNGSGGGGGGAITLTVPDGFGVTGSPLTPPGTLGITTTLTNLAKGTGSGFSNAVASVDYVPPGPIGSSGLTMTGTNLLGRYSSGTGAIQTISVSNGLSFYASQLLGPLNPTDTYIPKRSGSDAFADSPFRIDSTATTYVYTNVDQFEFRNNGAIHLGKDTLTNIVNVYQGTNILFYAFRDINNQGSPFPLVLLSEKDTTNTATSSLDGRIDSTGLGLTRDTNGIQNSIYIRPEYIELNTASASQLSIHGHPDWTSFATAPFFFNSMESDVTSSNLFQLQHIGTNAFLVRGNSGWTGAGTNAFSDDGRFKSLSALGAATVNPTSGYLPYNNSGTFGDSPWYRISTNTVGFNGTTAFLSTSNNNVWINSTPRSTGTNNIIVSGTSAIAAAGSITTGSENIALGSQSLLGVTTGESNVGIGSGAGPAANYSFTTSIGVSAGQNSGTRSLSIGYSANGKGSGDTAIGDSAQTGTGGGNVAIGQNAGVNNTTATGNTAIGVGSIYRLTSGTGNTIVGNTAGSSNVVGSYTTAIGYRADLHSTNSYNSVIIGAFANGQSTSTQNHTNAIAIGYDVGVIGNNTAQIGTNGVFVLYLNGDVGWFRGTGAPTSHASGLVTNAPVGSMYSRLDGGMNSSFYVVETSSGNWVAK